MTPPPPIRPHQPRKTRDTPRRLQGQAAKGKPQNQFYPKGRCPGRGGPAPRSIPQAQTGSLPTEPTLALCRCIAHCV